MIWRKKNLVHLSTHFSVDEGSLESEMNFQIHFLHYGV